MTRLTVFALLLLVAGSLLLGISESAENAKERTKIQVWLLAVFALVLIGVIL